MTNFIPGNVRKLLSQYTFQIDPDAISEDLSCNICCKMVLDAYLTDCGCKYCRQCITEYVDDGNTHCCGGKDECKEEELVIDRNVNRSSMLDKKVLRVKVLCPNETCKFSSRLTDMEEHLRVCSQQPMRCPYTTIGCAIGGESRDTVEIHIHKESLVHSEMLMEAIDNLRNEVGGLKYDFRARELETQEISRSNEISRGEERRLREEEKEELMGRLEEMKAEVAALRREMKGDADGRECVKLSQEVPTTLSAERINAEDKDIHVGERSKSAYLPPHLRDKYAENGRLMRLRRKIKYILNKTTPENVQHCLSEMWKLNTKEEEVTSCLVNEIFAKAVQEELYVVPYAQLCEGLSRMYSRRKTIRTKLLKKCQAMFDTPIQDHLDSARRHWLLKIEKESDSKMKTLYESYLEEKVQKAKEKYYGNIRFIGELYHLNILKRKATSTCISDLLTRESDPDSLSALCKIMETCGKRLDRLNGPAMDGFIQKVHELTESKELGLRIRFKLKDVVEMRQREWALRHVQQVNEVNPDTIEEQKEKWSKFAAPQISYQKGIDRRSIRVPSSAWVRKWKRSPPFNHQEPDAFGFSSGNSVTSSRPKVQQILKTSQPSKAEKIPDLHSMSDDDRAITIFNDIVLSGFNDIESWRQIRQVQPIITRWIDDVMVMDMRCRQNMGDFVSTLAANGELTTQQLVESSRTFITNAEHRVCDYSALCVIFAQFLERFIRDINSDISFFRDIFDPLVPHLDVAACLSVALHAASSRLGPDVVGHVFTSSSLRWQSLAGDDWETFVAAHGLEFTIAGGASASTVEASIELGGILYEDVVDMCSYGRLLGSGVGEAPRASSGCAGTPTGCTREEKESDERHYPRCSSATPLDFLEFNAFYSIFDHLSPLGIRRRRLHSFIKG